MVNQNDYGFSTEYGAYTLQYKIPTYRLAGSYENHFGDMQGTYAGIGPKNWQRSDESVLEMICETLTRHPAIDASDMEVDVKGGVVMLTGSVDHRQVKRLIEDVIDTVPGVKDIRNELRVDQGFFQRAREAFMEMGDPTGATDRTISGTVYVKQ